jgi:hypothetical protein
VLLHTPGLGVHALFLQHGGVVEDRPRGRVLHVLRQGAQDFHCAIESVAHAYILPRPVKRRSCAMPADIGQLSCPKAAAAW